MILLRYALWANAAPAHLALVCALALAVGFTSFIGSLTILRAAWRRVRATRALQARRVVKAAEAICLRTVPERPGPQAPPSPHPSAEPCGGSDD